MHVQIGGKENGKVLDVIKIKHVCALRLKLKEAFPKITVYNPRIDH